MSAINKVKEIADLFLKQDPESNQSGLHDGNGGKCLLLGHFSKFSGDERYIDKAVEILEMEINQANSQVNSPYLSNGLSGLGWIVEYFVENDWLDIDSNELLLDIDEEIYKSMINSTKIKNTDFLYGSLGIGIYFLKRFKKNVNCKVFVENLIDSLYNSFSADKNIPYSFGYYNSLEKIWHKGDCCLGVAHGIPGILMFLVKSNVKGISVKKTAEMINHIKDFLLFECFNGDSYISYFPNFVRNGTLNSENSRLAWCYGDVGLSSVLWSVACLQNNDILKEKVISIALNASKRKDAFVRVVDTGICHGSSGIAHIFNNFYYETKIKEFQDVSNYWYDFTMKSDVFLDGYAGYKSHYTNSLGGWRLSYNLLDGVAGVGLSLLASVSREHSSWEEAFLLK